MYCDLKARSVAFLPAGEKVNRFNCGDVTHVEETQCLIERSSLRNVRDVQAISWSKIFLKVPIKSKSTFRSTSNDIHGYYLLRMFIGLFERN